MRSHNKPITDLGVCPIDVRQFKESPLVKKENYVHMVRDSIKLS